MCKHLIHPHKLGEIIGIISQTLKYIHTRKYTNWIPKIFLKLSRWPVYENANVVSYCRESPEFLLPAHSGSCSIEAMWEYSRRFSGGFTASVWLVDRVSNTWPTQNWKKHNNKKKISAVENLKLCPAFYLLCSLLPDDFVVVVNVSDRRMSCCILHIWRANSGIKSGPHCASVWKCLKTAFENMQTSAVNHFMSIMYPSVSSVFPYLNILKCMMSSFAFPMGLWSSWKIDNLRERPLQCLNIEITWTYIFSAKLKL